MEHDPADIAAARAYAAEKFHPLDLYDRKIVTEAWCAALTAERARTRELLTTRDEHVRKGLAAEDVANHNLVVRLRAFLAAPAGDGQGEDRT